VTYFLTHLLTNLTIPGHNMFGWGKGINKFPEKKNPEPPPNT